MADNARHWSDAWGSLRELAERLGRCVHRAPVVGFASMVLRGQSIASPFGGYAPTAERIAELAADLREWADYVATRGAYEDQAALVDAADALDELAAPAVPLHAIASWDTEVSDDTGTHRYVSVGHGQSDQPPELVRVWAADPDEDDGVEL